MVFLCGFLVKYIEVHGQGSLVCCRPRIGHDWATKLNWTWDSLGQQGDQTSLMLKEINSEYSLEGLMRKLKLQYFGHLMWRADSLEKPLMLGEIEGKRREQQKMRWLDSITDSMEMGLSKLCKTVKDREVQWVQSMRLQRGGHHWELNEFQI